MPGRAVELQIEEDALVSSFLEYLHTEAGASPHTIRNYRQALGEFFGWYPCPRIPYDDVDHVAFHVVLQAKQDLSTLRHCLPRVDEEIQ